MQGTPLTGHLSLMWGVWVEARAAGGKCLHPVLGALCTSSLKLTENLQTDRKPSNWQKTLKLTENLQTDRKPWNWQKTLKLTNRQSKELHFQYYHRHHCHLFLSTAVVCKAKINSSSQSIFTIGQMWIILTLSFGQFRLFRIQNYLLVAGQNHLSSLPLAILPSFTASHLNSKNSCPSDNWATIMVIK